MPAISVNPPYPLFTDTDGQPLDDAYIYIGTANQNPVSNPITVYWDPALTITAAQPIRTSGGYPVYNGTPTRFYTASDYSILVRDKNGAFIYTAASETDYISSEFVTFTAAGAGAVQRTTQAKLCDFVSVKDYGAVGNGITDDSAAIQLALNAAAALGNAFLWLAPAATYKCGSGLTIDTNKVGIIGNGATLSFASMTTGNAITITQSNVDGNVRNYLNHAHPIEGIVFVGPGVATTAVRCFYFNDNASPNIISGGIVKNCSFVNFAKDVTLSSGAFCVTFEKCNFTILSGTPSTYSVEILAGGTNFGERNVFRDCMWNNRNFHFLQTAGDSDTYFDNCSLDGHARCMTLTGGLVTVANCHIESTEDTDNFFHVSGVNTILNILGGTTQIAANKSISAFYSDSTCIRGGIVMHDHAYWFSGITHTANIISGTGRTDVLGLLQFANAPKPPISTYQNNLAYGGFESANYTAEFTLANGAVRSTTVARTGTYSLSFPASSGVTPSAFCTIPCKPGQMVQGEYWYQVPAITGTGGSFYIQADYLDKGGNVIANAYSLVVTTINVSSWTQARLGIPPSPAGTVNVKILWNIFGTTSGTPTAFIDDVIVNVS